MKITILPFVALALIPVSCQQNPTVDESENVKSVVETYFDGIAARDRQIMDSVTTQDFMLYEDGRIFNNDSLVNFLDSFSSFSAEFTLDNFKINTANTVGNMSYHNRGDFVFNDTTRVTYHWLESATFKKIDGEWKMNFLHSTVRK